MKTEEKCNKGWISIGNQLISNNSKLLLSVIIPAYQCQESIERCIFSIARQGGIKKEIIVVDDGSTDLTSNICMRLQERVPELILYRQENLGASHARNRGARLARGEFIHFLDGDDYVIDGGYNAILDSRLTEHVDFILFNYKTVCKSTHSDNYIDLFGINKDVFRHFSIDECREALISTAVTPWNKIIRSSFLLESGIVFEDVPCANDRRFHFDIISRAKRVALCGSSLVAHEINNINSLSSQDGYKRFISSIKSFESILEISASQKESIILLIFDRCMMDLLNEYKRIDNIGERRKAITIMGELLSRSGLQIYWQASFRAEWFSISKLATITRSHGNSYIDALPIVMVCDDNYAPYLSVAIKSIQCNLKYNIYINIYILHKGLKKDTESLLLESEANERCMIYLVNISGLPETLHHTQSRHYTKEIYDRLWIPFLFGHYDKVLYLDCDLVVQKSIHHIFKYNIENKLIAGIRDFNNKNHHRYVSENLGINPDIYINSGVILFNTSLCLQHKLREKCLEEAKKHGELSCPDQDLINIVCEGRVRLIDSGWNYLWHYGFNKHRDPPDGVAWFTDDLINSKQKKYIVHYSSAIKPWLYPLYEDADLFWKYSRLSSCYSIIAHKNLRKKTQDLKDRLKQLNDNC